MRTFFGFLVYLAWPLAAAQAATVASSMPVPPLIPPAERVSPFDASTDWVVASIAGYTYAEGLGDRPTAVYDIRAHVVVLPDGARLEAHSGLAERADDPRFVRQRMRGPTPPALYDLVPRRYRFHGIAALRLLPILGDVFGRSGLLTHTYMLHDRPESNGCVVFRDYETFLRAYRDGRFRRLRVVPAVGDMAIRDNSA